MLTSPSPKTPPAGSETAPATEVPAGQAEQQTRHRTAVRIAGIEGIDSFADEFDDAKTPPAT